MYEQVLCLFHIMYLTISQYKQYRVRVCLSLTTSQYVELLLNYGSKIGRTTERDCRERASVELKQVSSALYFWESRDTVKWETVVNLCRFHEPGHASETVHWERSIMIVDFQN